MKAARQKKKIQYQGKQLILFQDLSKRTLDLRRALKPLLELLVVNNVQYRWKFPFQLQAQSKGMMVTFRDLVDLPGFLWGSSSLVWKLCSSLISPIGTN